MVLFIADRLIVRKKWRHVPSVPCGLLIHHQLPWKWWPTGFKTTKKPAVSGARNLVPIGPLSLFWYVLEPRGTT